MKIYWTQHTFGAPFDPYDGKVMRANLDGSEREELVTTAAIGYTENVLGRGAITLAPQSGRIFWSDTEARRVWNANPDGSDIVEILQLEFQSIVLFMAIDEGEGKIYWVDTGVHRVSRANLDGTDIEDLIPQDIGQLGIALDVDNHHMYLTTRYTFGGVSNNGISRANLDGSGLEELVVTNELANGIALDLANGHMYWTSTLPGRLYRAGLDGTNVETLVDDLIGPWDIALALNEGKVYWTDLGSHRQNIPGRIQRADLDGTNIEDIVTQDPSGTSIVPSGIAIGELAQRRQDFRFEYAAKLLCGIQHDPQDMRLAPGFYATTINIHNPHNEPVSLFKKLALTFPPGGQRPGQVIPIATDRLGPDEALAVDCVDIRTRLFPNGFPTPYVEGVVVIQSAQSLDVTAVYTTAAVDERGTVTSHSSIHVEQVRERDRARVPAEATDLLIRKEAIVRESSVTTPIVRYRIHVLNLGPAAAQNVVVSDTLQVQPGTLLSVPEGAFSATHGGVWSLGQVTQSSADLEATIPALPATEHALLEFVVVVQVDLAVLQAELRNTASVTSDTAELDPSNNSVVLETSLQL